MKIAVVAVGKLRDARLRNVVDEYLKRTRKYARCEEIEVRDAPELPGSVSRRRPEVSFMKSLLGDHRWVPLREGLEECWAWQRESEWVA